ncbi:MAG: electron transport complex subunit RsxE [Candidatus Omnitrophica bacterium]|nr:electron transport complex subunit RsxE [Candidatus Omnitrophota bacterium]
MAKEMPTALERFLNGILPENPVYRQLLGLCPTLAVTSGVASAMTMAGATAFVLICSNVMTSLIRGFLKPHLRILIYTLTIATFVTIADRFLAAYMWSMSKQLGPYVPLIIVNCVIVCRCEVCSSKQPVFVAASDALGQSLGFGLALLSIASVREVLATGAWAGLRVLPDTWPNCGAMGLPPGAFITMGLLLGLVNWVSARRKTLKSSAGSAK